MKRFLAAMIVWLWTHDWEHQDDVDRWMCPDAGRVGHRQCGHDWRGKPRFLP